MVYFGSCSANSSEEPTKSSNTNNDSNTKSQRNSETQEENAESQKPKKWGYDLYPERKGDTYKPSWRDVIFKGEGKETYDKIKCERNVYKCVKNSPLVKLMMNALKSSGCPIDIRRHIACEVCDISVSGGYDPELNQIVVCQNVARKEGIVQGVLAHEMIHMFDYCRNHLDFKNIDHLACTEIRAANLTHCSFISAWQQGDASPLSVKQQHADCVKTKAFFSVLAVRKVSHDEARAAVQRVFDRCYADLEPVGRRVRRNSLDMHKAYVEGSLYGYD